MGRRGRVEHQHLLAGKDVAVACSRRLGRSRPGIAITFARLAMRQRYPGLPGRDPAQQGVACVLIRQRRSGEGRVGKECVSTVISRWGPTLNKKKKNTHNK